MTFGALCRNYLEQHLRGKPSYRRYHPVFERILIPAGFDTRPAATLSRFDVLLLSQQWTHCQAQCQKIVGLVRQTYNWGNNTINPATMRPYYEGQNPAAGIPIKRAPPRSCLLIEAQLRALLGSLHQQTPKYRALFLTRLLTPGRILELCRMRWQDLSPDGRWHKRHTKTNLPQTIYVARQAKDAIDALPRQSEYVFPGAYGRHLSGDAAAKQWRAWRQSIGCQDVQLLDFRRTLATYLYRKIQVDDLTAKAVLNHYDGRPVAIYVRLDYDYLAGILQAYADWIWQFSPHGGTHAPSHNRVSVQHDHRLDAHHRDGLVGAGR